MTEKSVRRISNINDFPDEILSRIISLIPTKEAVRTSVLSTRWRYLFILISNLDIEMDRNDGESSKRFMNFVDRIIFFPNRPSILRLGLYCKASIDHQCLHKWISALAQHKDQQFALRMRSFEPFRLPASLFSCESLVKLDLNAGWNSLLRLPSRIFLPCLKELSFQGYRFLDDGSEERLFSSCPVLESLTITRCEFASGCYGFTISNQNLKKLTLEFLSSGNIGIAVPILVKAHNLVLFRYNLEGVTPSLVFLDVKSLVEAIIKSCQSCREHHVNAAPDVLRAIQNVQTLQISSCILQDICRQNIALPVFDTLTCLKFWHWNFECDSNGLEYMLSHCVVLETLQLTEMFKSSAKRDTAIQFAVPQSTPICFSSHLKTVEIHFYHRKRVEALMALFEFFLQNGKVLEDLKISGNFSAPEQKTLIMKEIWSFPKVSKICRVSFK